MSANLANFAYDPINYNHLREALAIELFIELLSSSNPSLVRHGIAGLCNLCLGTLSHSHSHCHTLHHQILSLTTFFADSECQQKIFSLDGIRKISSVLKHPSVICARDAIATLLQINSPETTELVFDQQNVAIVDSLRSTSDIPLRNFVSLYLATAAKNK